LPFGRMHGLTAAGGFHGWRPAGARTGNCMEYEVRIPGIGKSFKVRNKETILSAALRHKISLEFKCGNGSCKTCLSNLLKGSVEYPFRRPTALSEEDVAHGRILTCQAVPLSDVELDARVRTGLMEEVRLHELKSALDGISVRQGTATVTGIERAAHDVTIVRLEPDDLPNWLPGQYLTLSARGLHRDFSIASLPGRDPYFELQIRTVPRGRLTGWISDGMKAGDVVSWEGPLGTFFHRINSKRPILVVAGGTGFSPAKAVIESAMRKGASKPIRLYWGVRARRDLYAMGVTEQWALNGDFTFIPVLSDPLAGDDWPGETGYVHEAVARTEKSLAGFDIYIAGPPAMVEAAFGTVKAKGARVDRIFTDSFEFSPNLSA
ncbi:MAG: 2Fe-2S iron-sulfur cluster-binding protein, partial [Sphingomonadaceae bacterium]|nr:2Fe-2S iron-sulfur cluster-binding protein [Sphingomonadaceae bacterium]